MACRNCRQSCWNCCRKKCIRFARALCCLKRLEDPYLEMIPFYDDKYIVNYRKVLQRDRLRELCYDSPEHRAAEYALVQIVSIAQRGHRGERYKITAPGIPIPQDYPVHFSRYSERVTFGHPSPDDELSAGPSGVRAKLATPSTPTTSTDSGSGPKVERRREKTIIPPAIRLRLPAPATGGSEDDETTSSLRYCSIKSSGERSSSLENIADLPEEKGDDTQQTLVLMEGMPKGGSEVQI